MQGEKEWKFSAWINTLHTPLAHTHQHTHTYIHVQHPSSSVYLLLQGTNIAGSLLGHSSSYSRSLPRTNKVPVLCALAQSEWSGINFKKKENDVGHFKDLITVKGMSTNCVHYFVITFIKAKSWVIGDRIFARWLNCFGVCIYWWKVEILMDAHKLFLIIKLSSYFCQYK